MQDIAEEAGTNSLAMFFNGPRGSGIGQPARTYQQQLSMDTGCSLEDLPEVMDDRDEC